MSVRLRWLVVADAVLITAAVAAGFFVTSVQAAGLVLDIIGIALIGLPFIHRLPNAKMAGLIDVGIAAAIRNAGDEFAGRLQEAARAADVDAMREAQRTYERVVTEFERARDLTLARFEARTAEVVEYVSAGTALAVAGFLFQLAATYKLGE